MTQKLKNKMTVAEWRVATETQPPLPGQKKSATHSGRGREFEQMLNSTHRFYAFSGLAAIKQNPVEWKYCDRRTFDFLKNSGGDLVAQTNSGRFIKRVKSQVDFSGVARGRHYEFDAKQTQGKSLPMANVERSQIRHITDAAACGAVAGLMIYFTDLKRVFFLRAEFVGECVENMLFKKARKSISLSQCETSGVEITVRENLVDYLAVLGI